MCVCVSAVCLSEKGTKSGETLLEARSDTDGQIVRCICRKGRKTNRTIWLLVPSSVSLRMTASLGKQNIRGIGNMLFSISLKHVITPRGQILISRTDDDPPPPPSSLPPSRVSIQNVTMCTFKTSPCLPAPRAHVFQHVRVFPAYTNGHTTHATPHTHTHTHHRLHTHSHTQHHTQYHTETETETEKEDRESQEKTRRFFFHFFLFFFFKKIFLLIIYIYDFLIFSVP